jgi:hypothetical protein
VDADYAKTKKHPYRPSRPVRYRRHVHTVVPGVPGVPGRGGMKSYARRNKRLPLRCKYWHRGMAKSNTRKLGRRRKFALLQFDKNVINYM